MPTLLRRVRHGLWRLYRRPLAIGLASTVLVTLAVVGLAGRDHAVTTEVLVARRDVPAGVPLSSDDVTMQPRPADDLPVDAVTGEALGRTSLVGLAAGEVVLERRLAPGGIGAVASLVAPGAVGVWLPPAGITTELAVGDRLDLLVLAPTGTDTAVVGAPVIGVDDQGVTVAVPETIAPNVVEAVVAGVLVPVVAPSWTEVAQAPSASAANTTTPSSTR